MPRCCPAAALLLLSAAMVIVGCAPRTDCDVSSTGATTSPNVTAWPQLTVSPQVTVPVDVRPPGGPAAFSTEDPVLYDSGYEDNNDSCMVCHIDFEREEISSIHLEAGVTCMACHGDSEVHRADEYNIIRPDVIWGRSEIEAFCKQCHQEHQYPKKVEAFLEEWNGRRRPNGRWVLDQSVCTDCHGEHAIVSEAGNFK